MAERKNMTIMEVVRAMFHDQQLPKFRWGEATNKTVYVQNKTPHLALGDMTPEEVFTRVKPNVGHLRIFGCLVYFDVEKYKRNKVEVFGKKGTFVGYSEDSKAYRIYVRSQRNIEFIRDVTLNEEAALGKARDTLPPANIEKKDDGMDIQEGPPMPRLESDLAHDHLDPMDPLDPPQFDLLARETIMTL